MKTSTYTKSSHLLDALRRLAAGCTVLAMTALAPSAHASLFVFQWDDGEPSLTGNTYQDGELIQSVVVGNESYNGGYGLWNNAVLSSGFNQRINIYDADRKTLSDTWSLDGFQGDSSFNMSFLSDMENIPLQPLIEPTLSLVETGDWQTVLEFDAFSPTGAPDHYVLQFRSDAEVPEPGSLALLGVALLALVGVRRKFGQ